MKVAVWDTYVTKDDGAQMHFDILAEDSIKDEQQIYTYGNNYLASKGLSKLSLTTKECRFCHIEEASAEVINDINKTGYSIIEMEGC